MSFTSYCYEYIGDYELLPLPEAEARLNEGYCFDHNRFLHYIPDYEALDFSDCDPVRLEYLNAGYAIPYYAFYQYLGVQEYLDSSRTYVAYHIAYIPAIETGNWEGSFKDYVY